MNRDDLKLIGAVVLLLVVIVAGSWGDPDAAKRNADTFIQTFTISTILAK